MTRRKKQVCGAWGSREECRLRIAALHLNIETEGPQHYLKVPSPAGWPLPQERPKRVWIWYLPPHTHPLTAPSPHTPGYHHHPKWLGTGQTEPTPDTSCFQGVPPSSPAPIAHCARAPRLPDAVSLGRQRFALRVELDHGLGEDYIL